jgi:hypothetical protein
MDGLPSLRLTSRVHHGGSDGKGDATCHTLTSWAPAVYSL